MILNHLNKPAGTRLYQRNTCESRLFFADINDVISDLRLALMGLLILLVSTSLLFAQTEVSGDVFGIWTLEGSPYIVVDTITVPQNESLTIEPGVEVRFLPLANGVRNLFFVNGSLTATGTVEDSIFFTSQDIGFWGIWTDYNNFNNVDIRLEYCVIDSASSPISNHSPGGSLILRHSRILSNVSGLISCMSLDEVTVEYCLFQGIWIDEDTYVMGNVDASHCNLVTFQHNRGGIFGALATFYCGVSPVYDNEVNFIGIDFPLNDMDVYNNRLSGGRQWGSFGYWYDNNFSLEVPYFGNMFYFESGTLLFENNYVNGINLSNTTAEVRDNIFNDNDGRLINSINADGDGELQFHHNLVYANKIYDTMQFSDLDNLDIYSNTIIFLDEGINRCIVLMHSLLDVNIQNNIFVGDGVESIGIVRSIPDIPFPLIRYNLFFAVNTPTVECELDEGNIFEDPQFRGGDPYDYHLMANSPCIDAGDPDYPLDQDNTPIDLGAYYYNQNIDHPPALISPLHVVGKVGTRFRYTAEAIDDYGLLHFQFLNLPDWLFRIHEELDWVSGAVSIEGILPPHPQEFTFQVIVSDSTGNRETNDVTMEITTMTPLAGIHTGSLTLEDSPYLIVDDVIVPEGETLEVEPGVICYFRQNEQIDLGNKIQVYGAIQAQGTPEDSIHFTTEGERDLIGGGWQGIRILGEAAEIGQISYSVFRNAEVAVKVDSGGNAHISHSMFDDNYNNIQVYNNSFAEVSGSYFVDNPDKKTSNYFELLNSEAVFSDCQFERISNLVESVTFHSERSSLSIHDCIFNHCRPGSVWGLAPVNLSIINNRWYGSSLHIQFPDVYGVIANNLFDDSDVILSQNPSIQLVNNVFDDSNIKLSFDYDEPVINNNMFYNCDRAIILRNNDEMFTNLHYNCFFQIEDIDELVQIDETNLFEDPLVGNLREFRLAANSPLIDRGDPGRQYEDADGSRNDIGMWGGPFGESYPYDDVQIEEHQVNPLAANYAELVSTYLVPYLVNADSVFGYVDSLMIVYSQEGGILIPSRFNTIGDVNPASAFRVICNDNSEWRIDGIPLSLETEYHLYAGRQNWLGHPFSVPVPLETALAPIADHVILMMNDQGGFWVPEIPVNTIGDLQPGDGYMIYVDEDLTFNYAVADLIAYGNIMQNHKSAASCGNIDDLREIKLSSIAGRNHRKLQDARLDSFSDKDYSDSLNFSLPVPTGLPYLVFVRFSDVLQAEHPAIIELYDDDLLVGKALVEDERNLTPVITWGGSENYGLEGFHTDALIVIRVIHANGDEVPVSIQGEPPVFGVEPFEEITLRLLNAEIPDDFSLDSLYPNPFNCILMIPYSLPIQTDVKVTIYNLLGREVTSFNRRSQEAGRHYFSWDASRMSSGLYIVQLTTGDQHFREKAILLK